MEIEIFSDDGALQLFWAAQSAQKALSVGFAVLLAELDRRSPGAGEVVFGDATPPSVALRLTPEPGVVTFEVRTPHPDLAAEDARRSFCASPMAVAIGKAIDPNYRGGFVPVPATPAVLLDALKRVDWAAVADKLVSEYASECRAAARAPYGA